MRLIPTVMLSLMLVNLAVVALAGPARPKKLSIPGLDEVVDRGLKEWNTPGLAIAVIQDGRIALARGYGFRDLANRQPVTPDTLFSIASASKPFTATLAAMLIDEQAFDLDLPLTTWIPDFRMFDPMATAKTTLRDLLCHRTGIPRLEFYQLNMPATRGNVTAAMHCFKPVVDFRSRLQYSNINYIVAGNLLERITGKTWESLLRERIFEPLGMKRSLCSVKDVLHDPDHAKPYIDFDDVPEEMQPHDADVLGPAGGIISSVNDLSRWVLFNLNRGKVDGKSLVNDQNLARIQSPQMPAPMLRKFPRDSPPSYGLGWIIDDYRGHRHVHHEGVLYGFTSLVSFLPDDGLGIVILANLNATPLPDVLERFVLDRLLKLEPIDWYKRKQDQVKELIAAYESLDANGDGGRIEGTTPSHPLNDYTGLFHHDGYGDLTVARNGDALEGRLTTVTCPLKHIHYDVFDLFNPVSRQTFKVTFQTTVKGDIGSLTVIPGTGEQDIVFTRLPAPKGNP